MIGAAIAWMIMSSPLFLKKRLKLNLNSSALKIYKSLFYSGCLMLLVSIGNIIHNSILWYVPFSLIVLVQGFYTIKTVENWRMAQEVMNELTKGE